MTATSSSRYRALSLLLLRVVATATRTLRQPLYTTTAASSVCR